MRSLSAELTVAHCGSDQRTIVHIIVLLTIPVLKRTEKVENIFKIQKFQHAVMSSRQKMLFVRGNNNKKTARKAHKSRINRQKIRIKVCIIEKKTHKEKKNAHNSPQKSA